MSTGTPLGLTYLAENQDQPEVPVNDNSDVINRLFGSEKVINFATDGDYTLVTGFSPTGEPPEWQHLVVSFTDTGTVLTTGRNVILPVIGKPYIIANATLQRLTFETAATGTSQKAVDADKVREIYVTKNGNVFAVSGQTNLTSAT